MSMTANSIQKITNGMTKKEVETSLQKISDQLNRIDHHLTKIDNETKRFFKKMQSE